MGERVRDELAGMGLQVQWQEVEDGRPNVVGLWETRVGGGKSLMFNGHMDTSYSGQEPWLAGVRGFQPEAFVQNGRLYGLGISNMKGALACYVEAVRALTGGYSGSYSQGPARTNVRLYGDDNPLDAPGFETKVKLVLVPVVAAAYVLMQRRRNKQALRYARLALAANAQGAAPLRDNTLTGLWAQNDMIGADLARWSSGNPACTAAA